MMIGKVRVPLRSVLAGAAGTAALTLAYRTEHLLRPAVQRPLDYDDSLVPGKIVANVLHLPSVTDREDAELGTASIVNVSCSKLIRVDFIAAGDLLNWVLARRSENRAVSFVDAHRLVALFFGAMGITEHARVKVRTI